MSVAKKRINELFPKGGKEKSFQILKKPIAKVNLVVTAILAATVLLIY